MGPKELNYVIFHHFLSNQTNAKLTWTHPPQHNDTYKKALKTRNIDGFWRPGCRYCCLHNTHSLPPPIVVALRALHAKPCGRTHREEKEGREREKGEITDRREVWVVSGDDADKMPVGFTGEGGRGEWWVWEKKKQNKKDNFEKSLDNWRYAWKICNWLKVHEKYITFYIKSWFLDFIKLGYENHIFPKLPHQNTSFPVFKLHNQFQRHMINPVLKVKVVTQNVQVATHDFQWTRRRE